MAQDTRNDPRARASMIVRYESATVDEFIADHAHDLSPRGIFIKTPSPFPRGTLLDFEIRIQDERTVLAGTGVVVWTCDTSEATGELPAGMRVRFTRIDDKSKALLQRIVEARGNAMSAFQVRLSRTADLAPRDFKDETPPSAERVDMKQAAELLKQALAEAGASIDEIGSSPVKAAVKAAPPGMPVEQEKPAPAKEEKPAPAAAEPAAAEEDSSDLFSPFCPQPSAFSLKELEKLEEERILTEEAGRIRTEEEQRRTAEQRSREDTARLEAIRVAEIEKARVDAEQRSHLGAMAAQQQHGRSLAAINEDEGKKKLRKLLAGMLLRPRAELVAPAATAEPSASAERRIAPAPPWAMAYRPSWILPRRQSSLYIYVFLPDAKRTIDDEARSALDTPGNRARGAHAVPLYRAVRAREMLVAEVEIEGFKVGRAEPVAWSPPYVRFVIPILAPEGVAIGTHRPIVSIRGYPLDGPGELLARLDFDIEVRAAGKGRSLARVGFMSGGIGIAVALATAVQQHALPSLIGLPASAACLAGGVGAWVAMRPAMDRAEVRDVSKIFVSYAREDIDRVRQAVSLLRAVGLFPWIDIDQLLGGDPWEDRIEAAIGKADRFFLFWSRHARDSRNVTEEWKRALARAQREASFIVPVMLDADRPANGHPLSRFQYVFLDGQGVASPMPAFSATGSR